MVVLQEQDTVELQSKLEGLADILASPDQSNAQAYGPDWRTFFRTDTDLVGLRSMLAQQRRDLCSMPARLPPWQVEEASEQLERVELCVKKMEKKATSTSAIYSAVRDKVMIIVHDTISEIYRGHVLAGAPASALRAAIQVYNDKEILDEVFQRARLEALDSDVAIKRYVVISIVGLLHMDMVKMAEKLPDGHGD